MLGRIVLILVQLAGAWFLAHFLAQYIPVSGIATYLLYAVLFAVFAWLIGVVSAEVIKGVNKPQGSSFGWSIVLALVGAAILIAPGYVPMPNFALQLGLYSLTLPLIGAVLGYQLGK
jgi:hypothetical protein